MVWLWWCGIAMLSHCIYIYIDILWKTNVIKNIANYIIKTNYRNYTIHVISNAAFKIKSGVASYH